MDGLKTTEEFTIQNLWRLECNLELKVVEKRQKKVTKVAKDSTFCVILLQQKLDGTH